MNYGKYTFKTGKKHPNRSTNKGYVVEKAKRDMRG